MWVLVSPFAVSRDCPKSIFTTWENIFSLTDIEGLTEHNNDHESSDVLICPYTTIISVLLPNMHRGFSGLKIMEYGKQIHFLRAANVFTIFMELFHSYFEVFLSNCHYSPGKAKRKSNIAVTRRLSFRTSTINPFSAPFTRYPLPCDTF